MNVSLHDEYGAMLMFASIAQNAMEALKRTVSRIRDNDTALDKEAKGHLLMSITGICGAEKCYDAVLEELRLARHGTSHANAGMGDLLPRETFVTSDEELECYNCVTPIPYGETTPLIKLDTGVYCTFCETCRKPEERTAK